MKQNFEITTGIYRHYKGGIYEVVTTACHSETLEKMIVYRNISTEKVWVRPAGMWKETFEVGEKSTPRFQFIAASLDDMDGKPLFKTIEDVALMCEKYDRNSENSIFAFCHRETGEVIELTSEIAAYMDGDISEDELQNIEPRQLAQIRLVEENPHDYVQLPHDGLWNEYDIMSDFASLLPPPYSDKLENALEGKGAFRRFKNTVAQLKLKEHWYSYRDSRIRREIREWCEAVEIQWWKTYMDIL